MADARTTGDRVESLLGDPPTSTPSHRAERHRAVARARAWLDEYHRPDVGPDFDLLSYIARGRTYTAELVRLLDQGGAEVDDDRQVDLLTEPIGRMRPPRLSDSSDALG